MRAALAALLLILTGAASGQPPAPAPANPSRPPPSIVRAQIVETRVLGVANCSDDPQAVCIDALIEARLSILGQVAGPRVPSRPVVRYIYHIPAPLGAIGYWLVARGNHPGRYRPALPLDLETGANRGEPCFAAGQLAWFFGVVPPGGTARGEDLCYPR